MDSGRNDIVPCSFRRRTGQDRRRDLQKAKICHPLTQFRNNPAPQDDLILYLRISQIQIPVFQPDILVRLFGMIDLKRQGIIAAAAKYGDLIRNHLDISGRQIRVLIGTLPDNALNADRRFVIDTVKRLHDLFRFDDDLRRPVKIPQDQETKIFGYLS